MKPAVFYAVLALPLAVLAATQFVIFQESPPEGGWLYPLLIANAVLIVSMLLIIAAAAVNFWRSWRRNKTGARLAGRLAWLFLGMAFLPAAMLYIVSAAGVSRGIESWFATPLHHAFREGLAFGQHVLGQEFDRLQRDARSLARIVDSGRSLPFWRDDLRLLYDVESIVIYGKNGLSAASSLDGTPLPAPALTSIGRGAPYRNISGGARRKLEVVVPLSSSRTGFALKVSRVLPEGIDAGLAEVERGRRAYENLLISRRGLLYSFMASLTLAFAIVLAFALWASVRLGARLFRPLTRMSYAAAAVGRGDFDYRLADSGGDDEIADLGRAFNSMVDDLQRTRRQIAERQKALSETKAYLEKLLASLATGVLAVDAAGRLAWFNGEAEKMLQTPLASLIEKHFSEWGGGLAEIAKLVGAAMSGDGNEEHRISGADGRMLVARLRRLPLAGGGGMLVMADDISRQIEEEREIVWEEASRRFAHEIKNPLTPIQLSADRMRAKLADKLSGESLELLLRLSQTITNQVDAMREMVGAFQLYAGNKSRRKAPVDLNKLAAEVARSYERPPVAVEMHTEELPPLQADAVLLRQALHNVLTNAQEASAGEKQPRITVKTELRGRTAALLVEDNGGGVPEFMRDKIFEPYQTSKEKGTGLGLAIVRRIMEEHGGGVRLENIEGGARATLLFPI